MKASYVPHMPCKVTVRLAALVLACLAAILLAAACGGGEEETPTPGGTPKATATGTVRPTAAATSTAKPTAAATGTAKPTAKPTTAATPTTGPAATPTAKPAGEVPGITDTEIILGADVPLSGGLGAVYATIPQATEAYFNYINDTQGGVCGRKIVYKLADNQMDAGKAVEAARSLVEKDKVFAIVGSLGDIPHYAAWDYLNANSVPDILISAGASIFGSDPEGHPWSYQMIPSYKTEATFFADYITENMPGAKVAIMYENSILGEDALAGLESRLDPAKNELVSKQPYENTAISVSSEVISMKNAGAEAVLLYSTPGYTSQAITQADRLGWHPQWFLCYINSDPMIFQFVQPATLLEGAITTQVYKMNDWNDDPAVAEFHDIQQKYNGPPPTQNTLYAHSLGELAVEILSRACDNLTREGLIEATESIKDWHTPLLLDGVNMTFGPNDHTAINNGRLLKVVMQDGKGAWEYFGPLLTYNPEG